MSPKESTPPRARLATQLDEWALIREKVLAKLDIRSAREARDLAHRIREVILRMADEVPTQRSASLVELRALCAEANVLLSDGPRKVGKVDDRATLPVPRTGKSKRPPAMDRTLGSGVQSAIRGADLVKNHALRRR